MARIEAVRTEPSPSIPAARSLFTNIFAGGMLSLWQAGLQIVFTPVFMWLLGPQAYGLLALHTTLSLSLAFLAQGTTAVLIREFGRLTTLPHPAREMRDLLHGLEMITLAVAVCLGGCILWLAPWIAGHWIKTDGMAPADVTVSVQLMAAALAMQWPTSLYGSGFIALNRQDILARWRVAISATQTLGAALLLWLVRPSVDLLLAWLAVTSLVSGFVLRRRLWQLMPVFHAAKRVNLPALRAVGRFAVGTMAIGLTTCVLTQADKILMAKYVSLDQFAAYVVGFTLVTQVSGLIASPIGASLAGFFAHRYARSDHAGLADDYRRWTQILLFALLPPLLALAFFPREILTAWLGREAALIGPVAALLPWIVTGTLLNGIMTLPALLQNAAGWVRLTTVHNAVACGLLVLALLLSVPRYGVLAGAWCWIGLNASYLVIMVPLMHRRLLPGQMGWWFWAAIGPSLLCLAVYGVSAAVGNPLTGRLLPLAQPAMTAILAWAAMLTAFPALRAPVVSVARRLSRQSIKGAA
jgi:O-antigen/teichoic acid export membrane protein